MYTEEVPVLLTGATGFVGRHLYRELLAAGIEARCASRRPDQARRRWPHRDWIGLDVEKPETIGPALEGCDAVIYLVHAMAEGAGYEAREARAADAMAAACAAAEVDRIVYLGGVAPQGDISRHLASRHETGRRLAAGPVPVFELRAGMIIGVGSESWSLLRDIALRAPFLPAPPFLSHLSEPVAIDDVVVALREALRLPLSETRCVDLPGPDRLSGLQMIEEVARLGGRRLLALPAPDPGLRLARWGVGLLTRADPGVAGELIEGLTSDLVSEDRGFWEVLPEHRPLSFDDAARRALDEERHHLGWGERFWEGVLRRLAPAGGPA